MLNDNDLTSKLPDGSYFQFWETGLEYEKTLYVDCNARKADDANPGTRELPFKTINAAARIATPGTRVLIREGTYRETVQPARGGTGPDKMICYEAAEGEKVVIKASVIAGDWKPSTGWMLSRYGEKAPDGVKVWETRLNPEDFKGYNPFCAVNIIHDRLFIEYDKTDMTPYLNRRGMVFVDGKPLKQVPLYNQLSVQDGSYWIESNGQKVHVRLPGDSSPDHHVIELTNREQCFAPEVPFLSYIKVKGLVCAHAANGAPVPQRGAISCFRGHHWIIEDCMVDWANTVGIDCGNECWHHEPDPDQILGNSIIRRNVINDCGVCGIAALGSQNLLIEDNLIEGTGWQRMELSWEAAGIKGHFAQNALIRRNIISRCYGCDALWLDVNNNNNRITSNVFIDGIDSREHVFIECSRDAENLIDNNIIWNVEGRYDRSKVPVEPGSSGWYKNNESSIVNGYGIYNEGSDRVRVSNNLIGRCNSAGYYAKAVAFRIHADSRGGTAREWKFYNNLFYDCGEAAIKLPNIHNKSEGNAYAKMPGGYLRVLYPEPSMCLNLAEWQEFCGLDLTGAACTLSITIDSEKMEMTIDLKDTLPMVSTDSKADTDFYGGSTGKERIAGPFQDLKPGKVTINIDPRRL